MNPRNWVWFMPANLPFHCLRFLRKKATALTKWFLRKPLSPQPLKTIRLLMSAPSHGGKVWTERKASNTGQAVCKNIHCSTVTFMKFLPRINICRSRFAVVYTGKGSSLRKLEQRRLPTVDELANAFSQLAFQTLATYWGFQLVLESSVVGFTY